MGHQRYGLWGVRLYIYKEASSKVGVPHPQFRYLNLLPGLSVCKPAYEQVSIIRSTFHARCV